MIRYGAVLKIYREDSLEDIRRNLETMKRLGMNTAVVWPSVYYWEEETEDYPYHTGKQILRMAGESGIKVVMETAGQLVALEYLPDFRMKDEYYCITKSGALTRDNNHYFFGYINYFHPEVCSHIRRYLEGIAQAYRDEPALLGYDIWNETMFESYDDFTMTAFAAWLKQKYGSVGKLNDAWETTYSDFSQVRYNQLLWASVMPLVDYDSFHKDAIGMIVSQWRDILHAADPAHPCVADNIHSVLTYGNGSGERAQDDWLLANSCDQLGISFYPKGGTEVMPPWLRSLTFSAIFSATSRKGFWVSEMQSHHQALFNPMSYVEPWMLRQWTMEAVAHGAQAVVFWKLINFSKGVQTGGRGLLDSSGQDTPRSLEAARMAKELEHLPACVPVKAKVAILYDRLAQDFTHAFTVGYEPQISQTFYGDGIRGAYKAFWDCGIPADILSVQQLADGGASDYRLLIVTGQLNMDAALAQALTAYCQQGGTVLTDGKFAQISNLGIQYPLYPGLLHDLTGYTVKDMEPAPGRLVLRDSSQALNAYYEKKQLHEGFRAEVLAVFEDGGPALLKAPVGRGQWLSLLTMMWAGYLTGESSAKQMAAWLEEQYHLRDAWSEDDRVHLYAAQSHGERLLLAINTSPDEFSTLIHSGSSVHPLHCTAHMAQWERIP